MHKNHKEQREKNRTALICFAALLIIIALSWGLVLRQAYTLAYGTTVYIPLVKGDPVQASNDGLALNFKPFFPKKQAPQAPHGTSIVYINSFGVGSFAGFYPDKSELSFGEHFLDYYTYRAAGFSPVKIPSPYFGARIIPLYQEQGATPATTEALKRARYVVLRVSKGGFALPIALADRNYALIKPKPAPAPPSTTAPAPTLVPIPTP